MLILVNRNLCTLRLTNRVITKQKSQITVLNDGTRKSRALGSQLTYSKKTVKSDKECWNAEGLVKLRERTSSCKIGLVNGRQISEGC